MMAFRTLIHPIAVRGWLIACVAAGCVSDGTPDRATDHRATGLLDPGSADLSITVTDGVGSVAPGGSLIYTITATNAGVDASTGAVVIDVFASDLTCAWTCAGASGGSCTASGIGNIFDGTVLAVGGSVTYTAACTLTSSTTNTALLNTATISPSIGAIDPVLGNNSSTDTDTVGSLPAHLVASKTVSGNFVQGGTVTYTIVLSNTGTGVQADNPGDELTDVLPPELTLVSASATDGTPDAAIADNTATWNGAIAAGGSVTITIVATINAAAGATVSNQATFAYDSQGTGTNDATGSTDAFPCASGVSGLAAPAPAAR